MTITMCFVWHFGYLLPWNSNLKVWDFKNRMLS